MSITWTLSLFWEEHLVAHSKWLLSISYFFACRPFYILFLFLSLSLNFSLSLSLSLTLVFHGAPGNRWYLPLVAISISAQVSSCRYLCNRSIVTSVRRFVSLAISWAFNIGLFFSNFKILSMRSRRPSVVLIALFDLLEWARLASLYGPGACQEDLSILSCCLSLSLSLSLSLRFRFFVPFLRPFVFREHIRIVRKFLYLIHFTIHKPIFSFAWRFS